MTAPQERHVVLTGPIQGQVTTSDGTTYDVSEHVIEVDPAHAQEVADLIGDRYAAEGHPAHMYSDVPFVHDKDLSFDRAQQEG